MSRGRKRGCPVNIRNWLIEIFDYSVDEWVRIFGLTSMDRTTNGNSTDGSSETDEWEEPFITKRSSDLSLEGDYIEDETTGERDPGQDLLNWYAENVGCENDATIRMTDPYGHVKVADYVVTKAEDSWDSEKASCSWDLEQIGEPEYPAYVHVQGICVTELTKPDTQITEMEMKVGDPGKVIVVNFTPENASNKRFKVHNSRQAFAKVTSVTENSITLLPVSAGETVVKFTSVNQARTCQIRVRVAE